MTTRKRAKARPRPINPKADLPPAVLPDREGVQARAAALLADRRMVILDLETTGVKADAEIVQVAVLGYDYTPRFDRIVCPPSGRASQFNLDHGILAEQVANAPRFDAIYAELWDILHARVVVAYNADFDRRVLERTCADLRLRQFEVVEWVDAMALYGEWVGDWDSRWKKWKAQKLPGGEHQALSDCQATWLLLQKLASGTA